jgi:hypothetical protein
LAIPAVSAASFMARCGTDSYMMVAPHHTVLGIRRFNEDDEVRATLKSYLPFYNQTSLIIELRVACDV